MKESTYWRKLSYVGRGLIVGGLFGIFLGVGFIVVYFFCHPIFVGESLTSTNPLCNIVIVKTFFIPFLFFRLIIPQFSTSSFVVSVALNFFVVVLIFAIFAEVIGFILEIIKKLFRWIFSKF